MLIQIAILIIVIVGCVHFVYRTAFKTGVGVGVYKGRLQVLEENLYRTNPSAIFDLEVTKFIEDNSGTNHSRQACKYVPTTEEEAVV